MWSKPEGSSRDESPYGEVRLVEKGCRRLVRALLADSVDHQPARYRELGLALLALNVGASLLVGLHVRPQVTGESESLVANVTGVGAVPGVQKQVVLEVGVLAESPVAEVAAVGPGPAVDVRVTLQVTGSRERLGADRALVGLLLGVSHAMVVEVRRCREPFATHGTLVGLLAGMYTSVSIQRTGRAERLPADVANVWFLTCVGAHMSAK